jgi:hypothetical protein
MIDQREKKDGQQEFNRSLQSAAAVPYDVDALIRVKGRPSLDHSHKREANERMRSYECWAIVKAKHHH